MAKQPQKHLAAAARDTNDPIVRAWIMLGEAFTVLGKNSSPEWFSRECLAAAAVVTRRIDCQESDRATLNAILPIYWNIHPGVKIEKPHIESLRDSIVNVCRLMPGDSDSSCTCSGSAPATGLQTTYQGLYEMSEIVAPLEISARDIRKQIPDGEGFLTPLRDDVDTLVEVVGLIRLSVKDAREATATCDVLRIRDTVMLVKDRVAECTLAFDAIHCGLANTRCLAPPAQYEAFQVHIHEFGFQTANLVKVAGELTVTDANLEKTLKTQWLAMQTQIKVQLKQAFVKWEEGRLCPQSLCFDAATAPLRQAVEAGYTEAESFSSDLSYWDERKVWSQRQHVIRVIDQVEKLNRVTRDLDGFNHCVLPSLGSCAMRLYAILGRGATNIADSFRSTIESWRETICWFQDTKTEPSIRVVQHLRTIAGVVGWLESAAQNSALSMQPPAPPAFSGAKLGQLKFRITDEQGEPFSGSVVQITTPQNETWDATTDADGWVQRFVAAGTYQVASAPGDILEIDAFTMTVQ